MIQKLVLSVCFLTFLGVLPDAALGQARDTASLFGTVSDAQGATIPNAKVTITSSATGLPRTAATDASGGFVFSLLPVGTYTLSVEQTGFRKYEQRNIVLQANENVRVNAPLEVGNVQETITVEAS